ncbi:MAG: hypothetical protein QOD06_3188 [Candidatus Binatota bacterium]|nr:hypothetical protein [Candidatus Binatota bacterium]
MTTASARDILDTERSLGDIMMSPEERKRFRDPVDHEEEAEQKEKKASERPWALLPQLGFSPEKGPNGGIKFTHRDFGPLHATFDIDGVYALEGQQKLATVAALPHLWNNLLVAMVEAEYSRDPTKEFFGLGNNEVGPDELSTHEEQIVTALVTFGGRPIDRLTLALTGGFHQVDIRHGDLQGRTPATVDLFPDLSGVHGGRTSPFGFSLVYNNRLDITRPTRGWSFAFKLEHVNKALGNDFQYTAYIADGSYLYPIPTRSQVLGLHIGGTFMDSKKREIPFFDLASLGGPYDLRGYFYQRFLGESRVMINLEYRIKVFDFNFIDIWRVRIDGVAFGDMGRVFIDEGDLSDEFHVNRRLLPRLFEDFRYSYGGGARFALGKALIARVDVGFSDEEKGLIYLVFGHTF